MGSDNFFIKISPEQISILDHLRDLDTDLTIRWNHQVEVPDVLSGRLSKPLSKVSDHAAIDFLYGIKALFRMDDPKKELIQAREFKDRRGNVLYALQQAYKGIPVIGCGVKIRFSAEGVISYVSNNYQPGIAVETEPTMDAKNALSSATKHAGPGNWKEETAPSLAILKNRNQWCLAWSFWLCDDSRRRAYHYQVNAADGTIINVASSALFYDPVTGRGASIYTGACTFPASSGPSRHHAGNTYLLLDQGDNTHRYKVASCDLGCILNPYPLIAKINSLSEDDEDNWDDAYNSDRCKNQSPEVDLIVNMRKVAGYFDDLYGYKGFDNNGGDIFAGAHDPNFDGMNSIYDEMYRGFYFGDGNGAVKNYLTALDVAAHEFTHSVTCHTSNLEHICPGPGDPPCNRVPRNPGCGMSFTLHEAISDIFAALITKNWDIGTQCIIDPTGEHTCFRTLNDPSSERALYRLANHMFKKLDTLNKGFVQCYDDPNAPWSPQLNTGPVLYAAYLMAEGGEHPNSGISVEGIGREKVGEILYNALLTLPEQATFGDLRVKMLDAAHLLYGNDASYEAIRTSIRQAFNAVGIRSFIHIVLTPPVPYERVWIRWPQDPFPPDLKWLHGPIVHWPVNEVGGLVESRRAPMDLYRASARIIVLENGHGTRGPSPMGRNEYKGAVGEDFAYLKLHNTGSEKGSALVNLFASPPDKKDRPSAWKLIGSCLIDNLRPDAEATAKIALDNKKILADLSDEKGEVCLIAQIDSSVDHSPFKARENLERLRYIDLENSQFICNQVKIK